MTSKPSQNAQPRWFALVNDRIIPMPRQHVPVAVLRTQSSISGEHAIIRDFESPNDEVLGDGATVDFAEGNVFYSRPRCEVTSGNRCDGPAKKAISLDDKFELTLLEEQPVEALLGLFGLPAETQLIRDFESPNDEMLKPNALVRFKDGPSFLSRTVKPQHIEVAIVTTSGSFPAEGYDSVPVNQKLKVQLARAVEKLKITDVTNWIARYGTRELDVEKSYLENNLCGKVDIDYGPREGGGGACR